MSTIATLVARLEGDNSGLTSTLQDSTRKIKQFYGDALGRFDTGVPAGTAARAKAAGAEIADKIIAGLERTLAAKQLDIKEQLYQGLIDPKEAQRLGDKAGASFNWGLSNALRELGDMGLLTEETRGKIIAEYRSEGLRAGQVFAAAQAEAAAASQAASTARWNAYGASVGRNISRGMLASSPDAARAAANIERSLVGVGAGARVAEAEVRFMSRSTAIGLGEAARGIAKVAQAGTVGAFAMREFTGAAFRLAPALGAFAELLPVIALAGFAIYEVMSSGKKQIEELEDQFKKTIDAMVDKVDQAGLISEFRKLEVGEAHNGYGIGGGFAGSGLDLKGQLAEKNAMLENAKAAGNALLVTSLQHQADKLAADLAPILKKEDELRKLIMNPPGIDFNGNRPGPDGLLKKVEVKEDAPNGKKDLADQKKAVEELAQRARGLASTWEDVNKYHINSSGILEQMLTTYDAIEARLGRMKNKTSEFAIALRKALGDLAKDPFIALMTGANPNAQLPQALPGLTSNGNTHPFFATQNNGPDPISELLRKIEENGGMTVELLRTGKIGSLTEPTINPGKMNSLLGPGLANAISGVRDELLTSLTGTLTAAFGPVALLMRAIEPALKLLEPLLDALVAPLAAVVEVIAVGLKPMLQILFPILRAVAIAFAFLYEIMARVSAGIATVVGKVIQAIGAVIAHIPFLGGLGHAVENAGKSMLNFAAGTYAAADEMHRTREKLESMSFGQTADAITGLGDAAAQATASLLNVPEGYKVALDRFLATDPRTISPAAAAGATSAADGGVVVQGDVYVDARAKSAREIFDAVREQARTNARSQFGDATRAPDTLK